MNKFENYVLCPVPRDQRPFFEYLRRKNSSFVGWVKLNELNYSKKFVIALLICFSLNFFVVNWFISFFHYPIECIVFSLIISFVLETIFYLNLFLIWQSTGQKLVDKKVVYEDSGAYLTKVWLKPQLVFRHEKLLYHYQVVPLIKRLEKTLQLLILTLILFLLVSILLLY